MKINSAQFIKGIKGTNDITNDGIPQIVFVGRSNVGKSSVINALLGRKDLARSSANPGKTQEINFFLINNEFYFADLPGYGYARVADRDKEKLVKLVTWFLFESNAPIALVIVLIDGFVGPTERDLEMINALTEAGKPFIVVANKWDKINKTARQKQTNELMKKLDGIIFLPFSAEKKEGIETVLNKIEEAIA